MKKSLAGRSDCSCPPPATASRTNGMAKRETEVKKAKMRVQMRPLKNSVSRKTALVKVVEKAKKSAAKIELITSVRRQGVPFTGSSYEIKIAPPINNNIPHHC